MKRVLLAVLEEEPKAVWPTWPFTKLTPEDMQKLLTKLNHQRRGELGDALM